MLRTGPGSLVLSALLLLGATSCGVTVSMNDIAAREELLDHPAYFDPTYESIFMDPPYRFVRSRGGEVDAGFSANGMGEPDLYPDDPDDVPVPGTDSLDLAPDDEPMTGAEQPDLSPDGEPSTGAERPDLTPDGEP